MLGASFTFACMGLLVKAASVTVSTGAVVAWRTVVTTLALLVVSAVARRSLRPVNLRMNLVRAVTGMVSMGSYFFAIHRLPLGDAVLVTYLSPILVAAGSPALAGERAPRGVWAALWLGIAGVALVAGPHGSTDLLGLAAALVAAVFASVAYLSVRVLTRTDGTEALVFWFSLFGAGVTLPWWPEAVAVRSPVVLGELVGVGLLGVVAQGLMTRAYRDGNAAQVAVYSYATPVFAYLFGLSLGEVPSATSVVGAALVVLAGALASRTNP